MTQTGTAAGPFSDSVTATGPITVTGTVAAPFTTAGTATGPFTRMTKTSTATGSLYIELAGYLDVSDLGAGGSAGMLGKPVSGVGIPSGTTVVTAGGAGLAVSCTAYAGTTTLTVVPLSSITGVTVGQVATGYGQSGI